MKEEVQKELTEFGFNEVKKEEWEFGLLPLISETATEHTLKWMDDFSNLSEEAKGQLIDKVFEWLGDANEGLSNAIIGTTGGLLESRYDSLAHKLTKAEWDDLLFLMQFAHLVVLRVLNETLREKEEKY